MAHELTVRKDGIVEMMYAGEMPWHRLGTKVEGLLTSAEAIEAAHLDWSVEFGEIYTAMDNIGGHNLIPKWRRTFRDDNDETLGIVGSRYTILQNAEAFDFMDELLGEIGAFYETAGSLKGGKSIWLMVRLPDHITVGEGDELVPYLVLKNSHDGTGAVTIAAVMVRVVCANTLSIALGGSSNQFKIRHTASMHNKVERAREAIELINENFHQYSTVFQEMLDRELSDDELEQYIIDVVDMDTTKSRGKNIYSHIESLYKNHATNNTGDMSGTLWAAYNAITYWVDHNRGLNQFGRRKTTADEAALFGSGATIKQKAYDEAALMVEQ
jgi:phage/plasmid-like protein (TIGR03299 family)